MDKSAEIDYLKPGKGTLTAHFKVTDEMIADVHANTPNDGDKYLPTWQVDVIDGQGVTVSRVRKTLYIRKGTDDRKRISDK